MAVLYLSPGTHIPVLWGGKSQKPQEMQLSPVPGRARRGRRTLVILLVADSLLPVLGHSHSREYSLTRFLRIFARMRMHSPAKFDWKFDWPQSNLSNFCRITQYVRFRKGDSGINDIIWLDPVKYSLKFDYKNQRSRPRWQSKNSQRIFAKGKYCEHSQYSQRLFANIPTQVEYVCLFRAKSPFSANCNIK